MSNKINFLILISVLIFSSCRKRGCTDPLSLAYEIDASKDENCVFDAIFQAVKGRFSLA